MYHKKIVEQLSPSINKNLVKDLLKDYREIKKNYYLNTPNSYELAINKSGKFCETVFQILKYITSKQVIQKPNFNKITRELERLPEKDFPESVRIIILRIVLAIYSIRSRRGTSHKSTISPNYIDCAIVVSACDWILSEFLRLYHASEPKKIVEIINDLVEKKIPLVEEFGDDLLVLHPNLSAKLEILIILYYKSDWVDEKDLKKFVKGKSLVNITVSLKNAEKERLIYRKDGRCRITGGGIKFLEERYMDKLLLK